MQSISRRFYRMQLSGGKPAFEQAWHLSSRRSVAIAAVAAMPLCKRTASYEETLNAVLDWKQETLAKIAMIGDSFAKDDGPTASQLQREVDWVLEDSVAAYREAASSAWQPCDWRQLELEIWMAKHKGGAAGAPQGWQVLTRAPVQQLKELWARRLKDRVPFQYLINTAHWRNYIFRVGPGVLIPRPETQIFPDLVASALQQQPHLATAPWLDLGTGSGAIAISTADVLRSSNQDAKVWAVDLSPVAVAHAAFNAELSGVQRHVTCVQGSWYEPVQHLLGAVGGILSNPPYIPRDQMAGLQAEVGKHEPWSALDGGDGPGLHSLKAVCGGAVDMLVPGGFLALETAGHDQAYQVAQLLQSLTCSNGSGAARNAFTGVQVINDCYGVPRFVSAFKCRD